CAPQVGYLTKHSGVHFGLVWFGCQLLSEALGCSGWTVSTAFFTKQCALKKNINLHIDKLGTSKVAPKKRNMEPSGTSNAKPNERKQLTDCNLLNNLATISSAT